MANGPQACGCHIYSGGFTVGVLNSGFDVVGQWEEFGNSFGAGTFELNYPNIWHPTDKAGWDPEKIRGIELFYANPPCAVWSAAGNHLGLADPRIVYTANAMEAGLEVEPEFFILESVPRAWSTSNGGRDYYTEWARAWNAKGYAVTIVLTNALLHGAPQARERFHFIAHKMKLGLEMPTVYPTDVKTVHQVIGDLELTANETDDINHATKLPNERTLRVMRELTEGESWVDAYQRVVDRGEDAAKGRFIAHRLLWDAPCATILDINSMVHPTQDRMLTVREGARLCGYPDWFTFYPQGHRSAGTPSEVTQAVIPYVGEFWGKSFMRALDRAEALAPEQLTGIEVIDWRPIAKPYFPRRYKRTLAEFQAAVADSSAGLGR